MRSYTRLIVVVLSLLLGMCAQAAVTDLTDDNFEHLTQAATGQTTGKWFVEFFAPWCGHCKRLEPVWGELDEALSQDQDASGILLAKVDATEARATAERFGIRGYPTLIYLADRRMYKYEGSRTVDDMKEFVMSGYKDKVDMDVPAPPSTVEMFRRKVMEYVESNEQLSTLVDDFEHIVDLRKNAAAILVLMGVVLGVVLGCLMENCGKLSRTKKALTVKKKKE